MQKRRLTDKVDNYNLNIKNGNNSHGNLILSQVDDGTIVSGALRVYWGIENPIQLKQFDEQAKKTTAQVNWRHSCYPAKQLDMAAWSPKPKASHGLADIDENKTTAARRPRVLDDSIMNTSTIDTSGVVLRKGVKKSNTVSYRGDDGGRWKRASINGHVYNNDTRVFIPVMGSCTSVMATNKMTTYDVIRALLDKFKIENRPEEFSLYIVPDKGGERLLMTSQIPLLERLELGPDETKGKLFLKEKGAPETPRVAWSTLTSPVNHPHKPNAHDSQKFETPVEKYVEHLPEEVEQLVALPEALLQGVLHKFIRDEEQHIKMVKRKYDRVKKMMMALLSRQESFV